MTWCAGLSVRAFRALSLEVRIRLAVADLVGYRYGRDVEYPAQRPGLPAQLVGIGTRRIDCSSATAYVLATAYPGGAWTRGRYRELQIMDPSRLWSPLDAVELAGIGSRVPGPVPGTWALCQAWGDARLDDGDGVEDGHSRLVQVGPDGDALLVFESTSRGGIGPRWSTTSYAELVARYPGGVRLAALGAG